MTPFHYWFDKMYPLIRVYYERVRGFRWYDEILPGLWLGGAPTYPRDYSFLVRSKVNAIVDIRSERNDDPAFLEKHRVKYLKLSVPDVSVPNDEMLSLGAEFINEHHRAGDVVLVHCAKGRGRSPTLVAAYLMKYHAMSFEEADHLLESIRPLVALQGRHKRALREWVSKQDQPEAATDI